jgi:hypothetical protein
VEKIEGTAIPKSARPTGITRGWRRGEGEDKEGGDRQLLVEALTGTTLDRGRTWVSLGAGSASRHTSARRVICPRQ